MKILYKKYGQRAAVMISCLVLGQMLLQSCSKENTKGGFYSDEANINISVLGVSDKGDDGNMKLKASSAIREAVKAPDQIQGKLLNFNSFDAVVSLEKAAPTASRISIGRGASSDKSNGLAAELVETGVTYRLFFYTEDGDFVTSAQLTSGTPGDITVPKGDNYNWYAVSYNDTEDIPAVDLENPSLALPANKDVLYASGELNIAADASDETIALGIVFEHAFARIAIELNTMGMFADMESAVVEVSGNDAKTGTLNILTGTITDLTDATATIDYSSFVDVDANYSDRKVAYFYTAAEDQLGALSVSLKGLSLAIDDGSTRSFTSLATSPSVFNFDITPQRGSSYTIRVDLVESPLTFDGVQWARQNLYYTGGHNPYRFHHTYAHTNNRNSYFSFQALTPNNFGIESDPCLEVYPAGTWRQASQDDYETLTGTPVLGGIGGVTGEQDVTYGTENGMGYFEYEVTTGTGAPYPGNNLRFNFNGSGISLGLVNGILELDLGSTYGNSVRVWTSSKVLDIGILDLGAWSYGNQGTTEGRLYASVLQLGLLGAIDVLESEFMNVRCVRN